MAAARQRQSPRIFVQIPAYRDSELARTLLDMFDKAAHWDLLRIVVFWQKADGEVLPSKVRRLRNVEIVEVPYEKSRGCNWARNCLQERWQGEPYTLLLDSHHRFAANWDRTTVEIYEGLIEKGVHRPMLTAYLPSYLPEADPYGRKKKPCKIYPLSRQEGMLVRVTSYPIPYWRKLQGPIDADFACLHFLFADGAFNRDIRFDPDLYFVGDEVSISVRAYTHGYDLFHPHVIVGWHCYDRDSRVTHWTDHADWHSQHQRSMRRLHKLFSGKLHGSYGLGKCRTIREYEDRILVGLVEQRA
jgi:UDP-N-acetylglucosamine (GlcNAc):hydroxyproline polypeptide GlcNAc-transferase